MTFLGKPQHVRRMWRDCSTPACGDNGVIVGDHG